MPRPSYRCDVCVGELDRCSACRARRAAARRAARGAYRDAGRCIHCGAATVAGQTRCANHAADNAIASGLSHGKRRARP